MIREGRNNHQHFKERCPKLYCAGYRDRRQDTTCCANSLCVPCLVFIVCHNRRDFGNVQSSAYSAAAAAAACPTRNAGREKVCCTLLRCCAAVGVHCLWRTRCTPLYQHTHHRDSNINILCAQQITPSSHPSDTFETQEKHLIRLLALYQY